MREATWAMAYTPVQRVQIMNCIRRHNVYSDETLKRVPLIERAVRAKLRDWHYARWRYLLEEYEKVLPSR